MNSSRDSSLFGLSLGVLEKSRSFSDEELETRVHLEEPKNEVVGSLQKHHLSVFRIACQKRNRFQEDVKVTSFLYTP